ncbi:bifunctional riboflavin kinase/FAD synthetase [Mesorhizobium sp. LHD-90]|uniref:bifunctional riboflavin kinase/FAD synthetase n=1 Tax=Mesorhizobium sp. LHD-90 TaxID=3071414 RepID=UPI0027DF7B82|nr:bifunctional riboflavin kinase/FAD synthetase [Mesorhizobium sp. LHD-90]MDQ6435066.1 bifunctional riboflavin kinase/FAD synthetase [Mesorhizobium sp. LHD-90]
MTTGGFERLTGSGRLPQRLRGGVVAIGNFDGVHRGHQAVLERALVEARARGVPALVLTFEPHPRAVFRPDIRLPRITPAPVKARLVRLLGFDALVEQPFTRDFAGQSADDFIDGVLLGQLGVSHVVTGFDFHFGKNRQGDPAFLVAAGKDRGFGVTQVEAFCDEGGEAVSSSRIRALLEAGDVSQAAGLLGYRFTVEGEVVHGKKLGRTLGFPTANMIMPEDAVLRHGIYAVRLRRPNGDLHDGVASFGRRPTVESEGEPLLETYVFDFAGDLYHEICDVSFFGFLRGEEKFDGLDALLAQMQRDKEEARALLSDVRPLSELDQRLAF